MLGSEPAPFEAYEDALSACDKDVMCLLGGLAEEVTSSVEVGGRGFLQKREVVVHYFDPLPKQLTGVIPAVPRTCFPKSSMVEGSTLECSLPRWGVSMAV